MGEPVTNLRWTDEPISNHSADAFDRSDHAKRIAALIDVTHNWESSTVFGLTGPWGSGKSSLIEMIAESLGTTSWHVARFTPWAANDVSGLISEFYACLGQALPEKTGDKVRSHLATLAKLSSPALALIPIVGGSAAKLAGLAETRLAEQKPWQSVFNDTVAALKDARTRVLVVADDIDRLQPDELMAVLKVVRLLGRFPGVQYLLAYDERTLFRTLELSGVAGERNGSAENFMEKIVQYPVTVPPLLEFQSQERLNSGITTALTAAGRAVTKLPRLMELEDVIRRRLRTPRAIDRFIAQVYFHLPMMPYEEINDTDVILLALLRVSYPTIYPDLPAWREVLVSGRTNELDFSNPDVTYHPADWSSLVRDVPANARADAEKILIALFPKLASGKPAEPGDGELRRISDEKYFDRYFSMGIPRSDIADIEVGQILAAAMRSDASKLREILVTNRARADLFITKARIHRLCNDAPADSLITLIGELCGCVTLLPDDEGQVLGGTRHRVAYWITNILVHLIPDETTNPQKLLAALANTPVDERLTIWMKFVNDKRSPGIMLKNTWMRVISEALDEYSAMEFLRHLRLRDAAPADWSAFWYMVFNLRYGRGFSRIRDGVAELLASGEVALADFASRFVTIGSGELNGRLEVSQVAHGFWHDLAPRGPSSLYDTSTIEDVDETDYSWANRRKFAQGRMMAHEED